MIYNIYKLIMLRIKLSNICMTCLQRHELHQRLARVAKPAGEVLNAVRGASLLDIL